MRKSFFRWPPLRHRGSRVGCPASAMTVGTASGIQAAIADTSVLDEVAYVCRHRDYSSRRVCWWRPGGYYGYRRYWRYRRW